MDTDITFDEENYYNFFGLHSNPFPIAPDSEFFYVSEAIERIITELVHGIITRKGFLILTGQVGLGKTTISRRLLFLLDKHKVKTSLVLHTSIQNTELLREINRDFGLNEESLLLSDQMTILNNFLIEQNNNGINCVIIIDDAQNLDFKSFELVRMISNLEADRKKLVQILLIGQPELYERLNTKELRQIKSRISINKEAVALNSEEVHDYIYFKLNSSGNTGVTSIDREAMETIHKFTGGNFREINVLMDRSLYVAFLCDTTKLDKKIITEAYYDINRKKSFTEIIRPNLILSFILTGVILWIIFSIFKPTISFTKRQQNITTGTIIDERPTHETAEKENKLVAEVNTLKKQPAKPPVPMTTKPLTPTPVDTPPKAPVVLPQPESPNSSKNKEPQPEKITSTKKKVLAQADRVLHLPEISKPVTNFLSYYNLVDYKYSFNKAINLEDFETVKTRVYNTTGYTLIELDTLTPKIKRNYGILSYNSRKTLTKRYLLFWKPELEIKHFYYDYYGKEIFDLQDILRINRVYTGKRDGIIGKHVMTALNTFQRMMKIPVTGFPDNRTIFLLYNYTPPSGE